MKKTCPNGHGFEKSSDCPTCPACETAKLYHPGFPKLSKPASFSYLMLYPVYYIVSLAKQKP